MVEEHVTPQGEKLYVQVIKTPVYDALGRVTRTQGIFWDVTEKYRAQEDLRQAYAELAAKEKELLQTMEALKTSHEELIQAQLQLIQAEKLESVGRLAAGVAHEVKNPLAVLLMGLDYLKGAFDPTAGADASGSDDGTVAQVIDAMHDAVERADSIVPRAGGFLGQPPARPGGAGRRSRDRAVAGPGETRVDQRTRRRRAGASRSGRVTRPAARYRESRSMR